MTAKYATRSTRDKVSLLEAAAWEITGGADKWRYRLEFASPTANTKTKNEAAAGVLHCLYAHGSRAFPGAACHRSKSLCCWPRPNAGCWNTRACHTRGLCHTWAADLATIRQARIKTGPGAVQDTGRKRGLY